MNHKIRILVITFLPWRGDNSIGNSYSNIFRGMTEDKYEFAQVYFRNGMPQNDLVHKYYHVSEMDMIKAWFKPNTKVGRYFYLEDSTDMQEDKFSSAYNMVRMLRWPIFFCIRELAGLKDSWKTKDFDNFIDQFNPDIVFGTLSQAPAINRMMWYVSKKKNIPLITYPWDDYYSLDHSNFSPVFWFRKWYTRHFLRKTAIRSDFMYCISNLMIDEYSKEFKQDCRLLFKGYDFDREREIKRDSGGAKKIIFMGNIGQGRWKTLARLAEAVKRVNEKIGSQYFLVDIYTLSPKNAQIEEALNVPNVCILNPPVPNDKVLATMNEADVLVHAEPLEKTEIQFFRASFSTKLVDYFYNAKCILAIGGMTASTDYLLRNDAAIVVSKNESIEDKLLEIANNPNILYEYAQKSWDCGVRNHQIKEIQSRMYNDFVNAIKQHKPKF